MISPSRELVDLYGTNGFDVLCVTDHVGRSGARWHDPRWRITDAQAFSDYLGEIEQEAWRADVRIRPARRPRARAHLRRRRSGTRAHAVAIGLRSLVSLDGGLEARSEQLGPPARR